jgi:hypothetical protein
LIRAITLTCAHNTIYAWHCPPPQIMFGTQSAWYFEFLAGIGMAPARAMSAPTASAAPTTTGSGWHEIVLQPAVTCEFVNGPSGAILTTASASITTGRGRISSSWRLVSCPAPAPPQPTPGVLMARSAASVDSGFRSIHCLTCSDLVPSLRALGSRPPAPFTAKTCDVVLEKDHIQVS